MTAKIDAYTKQSDVKGIEIDITIIFKIIPYIIIKGGSSLNIMPFQIIEKLISSVISLLFFVIKMAN